MLHGIRLKALCCTVVQLVQPCVGTAMPINKFRGKFYFLSNFGPCEQGVEFDGDLYPTSEHAYQAAKIEDRDGRDSFTVGGSLGPNPRDAQAKGRTVKKRPGWEKMKVDVMLAVVRSKFARDAEMRKKLRATRGQQLVEGHTNDQFWGNKRNHLGHILMRVRDELPQETDQTEVADEEVAADSADPKCTRSKGDERRRAEFEDELLGKPLRCLKVSLIGVVEDQMFRRIFQRGLGFRV